MKAALLNQWWCDASEGYEVFEALIDYLIRVVNKKEWVKTADIRYTVDSG